MSLGGFGDQPHEQRRERPQVPEFSTSTDAFFLSKAGINPAALDEYSSAASLYDEEYDAMPDEAPLFEVSTHSDTQSRICADTQSYRSTRRTVIRPPARTSRALIRRPSFSPSPSTLRHRTLARSNLLQRPRSSVDEWSSSFPTCSAAPSFS